MAMVSTTSLVLLRLLGALLVMPAISGDTNAFDVSLGGDGGNPFTDNAYYRDHGPITAIKVRAGSRVDLLQVRYGDTWAPAHGGTGGHEIAHIALEDGEKVTAVFGKNGGKRGSIDQIGFRTNVGRNFGPYGLANNGDETPFAIYVNRNNCFLKHISGRAASEIDTLNLHFTCA